MYWIRLLKLGMVGLKVPNQGEKRKRKKLTLDPQPFLLFVRTIYLAIFWFRARTNESFFCSALGKGVGGGSGSLSEVKRVIKTI
jgi:hypothetical protein